MGAGTPFDRDGTCRCDGRFSTRRLRTEIIGKADYRRSLISNQSARLYCAYAYADASEGESTTDMVFAGENLVYENGSKLAATKLLTCDMAVADVDLDRLVAERRRSTTWTRADDAPEATTVEFSFEGVLAEEPVLRDACDIDRVFPRAPFVPADHGDLAERCETILDLQTARASRRALPIRAPRQLLSVFRAASTPRWRCSCSSRLRCVGPATHGYYGGLHAGLWHHAPHQVQCRVARPRPGRGFREVPIHAAVEQHFKDIEHDPAVQDVTYENSQARERTQILMDLANQAGGFVIGTGDLSELALGWATYNGDHMSMYAVNASVPKTAVCAIWCAMPLMFLAGVLPRSCSISSIRRCPRASAAHGRWRDCAEAQDLVGP